MLTRSRLREIHGKLSGSGTPLGLLLVNRHAGPLPAAGERTEGALKTVEATARQETAQDALA